MRSVITLLRGSEPGFSTCADACHLVYLSGKPVRIIQLQNSFRSHVKRHLSLSNIAAGEKDGKLTAIQAEIRGCRTDANALLHHWFYFVANGPYIAKRQDQAWPIRTTILPVVLAWLAPRYA
jgi:hypothetical protein